MFMFLLLFSRHVHAEQGGVRIDLSNLQMMASSDIPGITTVLDTLEYRHDVTELFGRMLDITGDGVQDYVVESAPSLCGTGGCLYALIDGVTQRGLGEIFGEMLSIHAPLINGYPVIQTYASSGARTGDYSCFVYNGDRYVMVSSVEVTGESLERLWERLDQFPLR